MVCVDPIQLGGAGWNKGCELMDYVVASGLAWFSNTDSWAEMYDNYTQKIF